MPTTIHSADRRLLRALYGLVLVGSTLVVTMPAANAAFPGTPGEIIYTKQFEDRAALYRINPAAPGDGRGTEISPGVNGTLSPDGQSIAFENGGIYVEDVSGQNARLVAPGGEMPTWSPDGSALAYVTSTRNIARIKVNGTDQRQLTFSGSDIYPSWSPGRESIAFTSAGL